MAYSTANRLIRRIIINAIAVALLLGSFYAIVWMQNLKNVEENDSDGGIHVKQALKCPALSPSKQAAYDDQRLEPMLAQTGLMGCYCFD